MPRALLISLMFPTCLAAATSLACAATSQDFAASYAAAFAAEKQAGVLHHQWTATETVLKEAEQANAQKHSNTAVALARRAEALATASIEQAKQQKTAWRDAVIK